MSLFFMIKFFESENIEILIWLKKFCFLQGVLYNFPIWLEKKVHINPFFKASFYITLNDYQCLQKFLI